MILSSCKASLEVCSTIAILDWSRNGPPLRTRAVKVCQKSFCIATMDSLEASLVDKLKDPGHAGAQLQITPVNRLHMRQDAEDEAQQGIRS